MNLKNEDVEVVTEAFGFFVLGLFILAGSILTILFTPLPTGLQIAGIIGLITFGLMSTIWGCIKPWFAVSK